MTPTPPASPLTSTVTLTSDASGNLKTIAIADGSITDTFTGAGRAWTSPATLLNGFMLDDIFTFPNEWGYSVSQVASQNLTSSAYGIWAASSTSVPSATGTFAFGNL